jgi:hypothetical protein
MKWGALANPGAAIAGALIWNGTGGNAWRGNAGAGSRLEDVLSKGQLEALSRLMRR